MNLKGDQLLVIIAVLSVGIAAGALLMTAWDGLRSSPIEIPTALPVATATAVPEPTVTGTPAPLAVYVTGAVRYPDVYELSPGSLAVDAVEAAGGFTADADPVAVNLARRLSDGMQLHIPSQMAEASPPPVFSEGELPAGRSVSVDIFSGLVNINTATEAELEALPGIGPSLAARIVEHRESNGPFEAVEDILNVTGIGDAKLEAIRELITVSP